MARIAMVTRTIVTTEVTVMCMNLKPLVTPATEATETSPATEAVYSDVPAIETATVILTGMISDEKTMMKSIKEQLETETFKPVHITSAHENETLYGITEEDFIKLAKVLPPRKSSDSTPPDNTDTTVLEAPTPEAPAPEAPAPEAPAPEAPTPEAPAPEAPATAPRRTRK
jgi:hypothetical protein